MPTQQDQEQCVFCAIASGAQSSHVVFEDQFSVAFLDRRPLFHGHSLLIPRKHVETLGDLPAELIGPLFQNAALLSGAIQDAMKADGSFVAVNNRVSQSVPHMHIHIVPRKQGDGLRGFFWPRAKYRDEAQMSEVASAIRSALLKLRQSR